MQLEWLHEFESESYLVTGHFLEAQNVPANSFSLTTDTFDENYLMLGVGTSAQFGNGVSVFIEGRSVFSYENLDQNSINAGLKWEF
jgi:hypothetical protein